MKKNKSTVCVTTIFLVLVAFIWVSAAAATVTKAAARAVPGEKAVDPMITDMKEAPAYKYNPVGKPDPFKPFINLEIKAKKSEMPKALPINPLQRAGVDTFRLVGIAGDQHSRIGMVTDVKGKFYPIFVGTYIGIYNGRVVEIRADRVIVEEKSKAEAKQAKVKRITMKLRKEEGEVKP